jgi:4-hydroxybenzoate polyprenyltransferase
MLNKAPYLLILRPKHWVKNIIVALPMVLANKVTLENLLLAILAFFSFSLLASAGYILNDIIDVDNDRGHVAKKYRPLASGNADVGVAFFFSLFLIAITFFINYLLGYLPLMVLLLYFFLNYFYTTYFKFIRFIDVLVLSSFYIIRIIYGSLVTDIPLTGWFIGTLTMSVLAIALNKRYMECKISEKLLIPGRGYTKDDSILLFTLMINFSLASIIFLNIHAYFVLGILSPYFYLFLNLLSSGIILLYFDTSKNLSDDPVERILGSNLLLIFVILISIIYIFNVVSSRN